MARSILVTGGAGYIGSVVVEQLLALGHTVVVLDDLSRGHRAALDAGAEFVEGGIADRRLLDDLLARRPCDALVHLAAYALVAESVARPQLYFTNNVAGGRVLLDAVVAAGVRRVIFSSSCAVYGHPPVIPIPEDAPRAPVNPYGETKLAFERLLADYATRHGVVSISLRYFNAAGATARHGEDHDPETHLVPNVLQVALGRRPAVEVYGTDYPTPDGTAVRDYVHIADIADAHVRALEADFASAVAVNLGTGAGHSVLSVTKAARRITGRSIPTVPCPRRPGDPPTLVAAPGRAERLLGWRPRRSQLDEILASAWEWHRTHPSGYPN
jgi:UDP-glucose 4-epimerase